VLPICRNTAGIPGEGPQGGGAIPHTPDGPLQLKKIQDQEVFYFCQ